MAKEKKQSRSWLLLNNRFIWCLLSLCGYSSNSQVANYIYNGGFEQRYNCNIPVINSVRYWRSIDSSVSAGVEYNSACFPNMPYGGFGFQWAHSQQAYITLGALCQPTACAYNSNRGYIRNRLKMPLQAGKTYCVKFYVSISDNSSYGLDAFGAYFGDNSLDTITQVCIPLTYLTPQVQNTPGNIITDTMNWVPVTGTFVASGTEKHCVIGNFKSDAATTKTLINTINSPAVYCNALIDDVSCIPLDLPAYASPSPDIWAIPGNTVYLGRPQDVGIDEACMWYKLPNTSNAIDTAAGITITVAVTTETYMVKQDICGVIKYDTVVVHASALGFVSSSAVENDFGIFPNPATDKLFLKNINTTDQIEITNALDELIIKTKGANEIDVNTLPPGIYFLKVRSNSFEKTIKFIKN